MHSSEPTDRAVRLERESFAEIFDSYYDAIYRYIYRRVRHRETAEDLAQEVFHRLVEAFGKGQGPTRSLKAWLYRVARNLIIDEARRQKLRRHEPIEDVELESDVNVGHHVDQKMMAVIVREALDKLTRKQKEVVELKFLQGLTTREIAGVLSMSERGVLKLQQRGVAALRTQLLLRNVMEGDQR